MAVPLITNYKYSVLAASAAASQNLSLNNIDANEGISRGLGTPPEFIWKLISGGKCY
jgi:hypothetical protein